MNKPLALVSLLFILLAAGSCRQEMLGAQYAVKNFITAPYRGIQKAISNNTYSNLRDRTEQPKAHGANSGNGQSCSEGGIATVFEEAYSIRGLQDAVRDVICTCKAWGSCTIKECPCEKLCPENFKILNRRLLRDNTRYENSLAFRNRSSMPGTNKFVQGFCWGHASVTSKFNRLAFFDESKKAPYSLDAEDEEEQNKAIDYYKKKIDQIVDNKAVDIEGFSDLRSFSDHPALESYIGDKVSTSWASNAMTFQGLASVASTSAMSAKKNKSFFNEIERKLKNHQQPQIVFNEEGSGSSAHAVLVSHSIVENGETVLCIRDNNKTPTSNLFCRNKMKLEDGRINYYTPGYERIADEEGELIEYKKITKKTPVGRVKLAHNDNQDTVRQVSSLVERCKKDKACD